MTFFDQRDQKVNEQININNLTINSLSDLNSFNSTTKQRLRTSYENKIKNNAGQEDSQLALGLLYLDLRLYTLAIKSLEEANVWSPENANILYYLALAHVGGHEPTTLRYSEVQTIESYIDAAIRLGNAPAHCFYLWAILKREYYLENGLIVTPPDIDELLFKAKNMLQNYDEIKLMVKHVSVSNNPVLDSIIK